MVSEDLAFDTGLLKKLSSALKLTLLNCDIQSKNLCSREVVHVFIRFGFLHL